MDVFSLTRALVDIESITGNEEPVGDYLLSLLGELTRAHNGHLEAIEVEPRRFNIFACFGTPIVTLSTHLDTVPPFFPSREDEANIWGRGACDVKGIIAAMLCAATDLLTEGVRNFGLLFVVGEERNSAGAYHAAKTPRGSKFIINGEPTENQLALGSKGALRYELKASGRMAHSAYPELGESAIEKLLDALQRIRAIALPIDGILGPCTLNIGQIQGGRAPNVVPDAAEAALMFRLVGDPEPVRTAVTTAAGALAEAEEILCIPAIHLGSLEGFATTVVAYTTDIPAFGGAWGQPFLLGPGTIHVAHTSEERVPKAQLLEAVTIYKTMVKRLLTA
ncbi:M20/M25/M40 family metallo-hydrolase [Paludibaculum fermentans]|uniref:M20/M25/M40 family metallo-hydrolase n=1 Tax=Paludibaculum fermentans TaxID=1473598 RepID=UPI003EBDE302